MKLLDAIATLDVARLDALATRWHVAIDPKKRLPPHEQVARGLSAVPRWLELGKIGDAAREAIRLLLAAPRGRTESSLAQGKRGLAPGAGLRVPRSRAA